MKAQDLKKSILQLAIQGKLVEQDREDIQPDFNGIKNKATDELSFDIPDSWKIIHLEAGTDIIPSKKYQILESEVKKNGKYFVISQSKEYSIGFCDDEKKLYEHETPVIVFGDHTSEVKYVDFNFIVGADGVKIFKPNIRIFHPKFLYYQFLFYAQNISKIGGYSRHYKFIKNIPFVVPPLAEQKRIVAKIEELEPLIAEYDTAETALTALNTAFPEQMKKSILQQAIQGKLVEQDPNDEPATVLLERIKAEKAALVKAGKIKKDKPLPPITEDEIPFDIPDSWTWVRLGDISNYSSPKKKISPNQITSEMWSVDLEDIEKGTGRIIEKHFAKDRAIQGEKVCFEKGNILYSKLRPYLLKILIAEDNGITSPELIPFNIYGNSYQPFFLWYLRSPYVDSIVNSASYGVKMPRVGTETMIQLLVPLPPLAEQKRIVAKIEELLKHVETLISFSC